MCCIFKLPNSTVKRNLSRTFSRHNLPKTCSVISCFPAPIQSVIKPRRDQTHGGEGRSWGAWTTSVQALVSTWLCLLSASQRAPEWGSIEPIPSVGQLMGFPGPGRRGLAAGLWLLILPLKHARNLPPGIWLQTITNPLFLEPTDPSRNMAVALQTWRCDPGVACG